MMTRVAMLLLAVFTSMGAWADESGSCGDGVTYTYVSDTNTLIISYSGSGSGAMADYTLPTLEDPGTPAPWSDEMNFPFTTLIIEEGVTTIGNYAFKERPYFLENVTLSSTVQTIGEFAFDYCPKIKALTIPSSVTSIGNNAFSDCGALATVTFDSGTSSLTIGDRAFKSCISLTSITIPSRVTSIGDAAFDTCKKLASITIPSGVANIGNYAFWDCDALTSITIPSSVTSIGNCAFINCGALSTVVMLPETPPTCGNDAFLDNKTGRKIYVPYESLEDYDEAANWSDYSSAIYGFKETGDCSKTSSDNVKWVRAGSKMVVYGTGAMADYDDPKEDDDDPEEDDGNSEEDDGNSEEGGNNTEEGGNKAPWSSKYFRHRLTTLIIEEGVTTIGDYAFPSSTKLKTLVIGSGVKTIGVHAFYNCHDINSLTLPDGLETIGDHAFYNCHDINSLTLPDGVETIGNDAFADCSSIPSVTIPSSVTSIGEAAFDGCSGLATVTFAPTSSVTTIGNYAFSDCAKLESITIPSSVTSIGEQVFGGCSKLTSISVEGGNTVYDSGNGCNAIIKTSSHTLIAGCQNTTIPNTVTTIGNYAFDDVDGLTSIEIPSSVTSIGDNAFWGCSALSTVVILPASLDLYDEGAFDYNKSGRKIYVPYESLQTYRDNWSAYSSAIYGYTGTGDCGKTSSDNVNWVCADMDGNSTGETMVIYGSGAMADYTQPDQAPWAKSFTTLNIEEGVTRIGNYAFQNCNGINTVNLPGKVTSIGQYAFDNAGLTSATLNSNPTIGNNAFGSGVALTMNLAASASNGYKWASFFNDYCNFQVDENTTVFKAKSNGDKVTLTAIADGIIPAGTAVVLRTPTDSSPVLTNTSSSTSGSYEDNELKGSSTAVTQEGAHTYYALAVKSGNVGLYKVKSSAKIPAGKAYLEDVIATTRDFLAFEDSEPTGIVDGRWKMEEGRGDGWYTLDGRKLNGKPKKKGMYVVNGNKVVIK